MKTLFALAVLPISTAQALADDAALANAVRECAAQSDDAKRLACYDRAAKTSAAVYVPQPNVEEQKFGYTGAIAREELDRERAQRDKVDRLEGKVTHIARRPRGELVLTLDNDQVWQQKTAESIRVRLGDAVVIKSGVLGSYLLVDPQGGSTRVTRIK